MSTEEKPPRQVGNAGLGTRAVLLLMWYWAAIVITVLALGAHQFQLKVLAEEAKAPGAAMTLSRVIDVHTQYRAKLDECRKTLPDRVQLLALRRSAVEKAEIDMLEKKAESIQADLARSAAREKILVEIRAMPPIDAARPTDDDPENWSMTRVLAEAKRRQIPTGDLASALEKMGRVETAFYTANERLLAAKEALESIQKELQRASCDQVMAEVVPEDKVVNLRGFVLELDAFSRLEMMLFFIGDPMWFVKMPNSILTLLLTLAMGALGSTIFVTVQFLGPLQVSRVTENPAQKQVPPWPWFIFRPFLGMIVALAVFIAFRAGQITLSATPGGGDNGINPFVISFFALIAGLLSEKSIEYLVRSGEKLLGGQPPKPTPEPVHRASGLEAALAADTTKTREALAVHMGVPPATVDAWIAGRETLSRADAQKIAAWLDKPLAELFKEEPKPADGG
jgi:hypothetical protein